MKILLPILIFFHISICFLFIQNPVFAQVTNGQTPIASSSAPKSLDSQSSANLVMSAIETFFKSLDSLTGGFIFSTPDFFGNTVTLSNGAKIKGIGIYRNIFYLLSIPVSAIVMFWFSLRGMANNSAQFIRQIAIRLLIYVFLLFVTVPILSLSIQATNLLSSSILSVSAENNPSIVSFVTDYFGAVNKEVSAGRQTAESLGFPNPSFFDIMRSIPSVVTQLFFLLFVVFSLTLSILFIFMQFIVRFLTLLFLSIIFPLISPFSLSEKN